MINVEISPALLSLPDRLARAARGAHEQGARETVNEVRGQIISAGAVASFSLLNSVAKQFEGRGAVEAWLVGSDQPHAPFVEYGRRPGKQPPVEAIIRWIAIKPIDTGGRSIRDVAFMIARAIGRRGLKPRPVFRRAVETMTPRIETIFTAALGREIRA